MDSGNALGLLYQYASSCKFDDFTKLFATLEDTHLAGTIGEAYLMRAQIKLFAADVSMADDLEKAEAMDGTPLRACLGEQWQADSANRFTVFSKATGTLSRFVQALPTAEQKLHRWYGDAGSGMVRQMHSEILYFFGEYTEALALARRQYEHTAQSPVDRMLALYVMFRCQLVEGDAAGAGQSMLEMVDLARAHPACQRPYADIRAWANLTTGWSGDTPRYAETPEGSPLPVLDDRLDAIRQGISRLSPTEQPFAAYAGQSYEHACTMRQHYMDIFHAFYWFEVEDDEQAVSYFEKAYAVSLATGLLMPFAEYGEQLAPLFRFIQASKTPCSDEWLARVRNLFRKYEQGIDAFRA